jgi:hypothetical protein
MRTEVDLDAAARAGLIDEGTAIALRNFQAELDKTPGATAEKFQLFGGYADITIALGTSLIMNALRILAEDLRLDLAALPIMFGIWFASKRLNMPSFPATAAMLMASFLVAAFWILPRPLSDFLHYPFEDLRTESSLWISFSIGIFTWQIIPVFCGWLYWRKFKFPPTLAAIIAFSTFYILHPAYNSIDYSHLYSYYENISTLIVAIATIVAAIWWDVTDIRRETERSQVAFWLHCCAGFLMTQALFSLLTGRPINPLSPYGLELVHLPYMIMLVAIAALVSLLLDRRSLLVGTLFPVAGMFAELNGAGAAANPIQIGTIFGYVIVGVGLISVSWGWLSIRRGLLAILPAKLAAQLPRTEITNQCQRPTRRHFELWSTKSSKGLK